MSSVKRLTLTVPQMYEAQLEFANRPHRYKLGRWGRRRGKTVFAFAAAVLGHGPMQPDGQPLHKGLRHGLDVLWVGRSKDQARGIWLGEVKPRFEAAGGSVNDTLMMASLPGFGSLIVRSQDRDSINNARGLGAKIAGIVGDEVAHWDDAEDVWLEVMVPMLADNMGWAIFISTTEPGSWFNRKCQQVLTGKASDEWTESYGTAKDNPYISPAAFAALVAEYPEGDPRLEKEVYALLTAQGAGHALHFLDQDVLIEKVPQGCTYFGAVDWGYAHPYSFGLYAVTQGGMVIRVDGVSRNKRLPKEIGADVSEVLRRHDLAFGDLKYTHGGGDVFNEIKSRGHSGKSIAEQWLDQGWVVRRANQRRVTGLTNMRSYFGEKRIKFVDNANNRLALENLRERVIDPDNVEDVLKQDADTQGRYGDDIYDEIRYALMSRSILPEDKEERSRSDPYREPRVAYHGSHDRAEGPSWQTPNSFEEVA